MLCKFRGVGPLWTIVDDEADGYKGSTRSPTLLHRRMGHCQHNHYKLQPAIMACNMAARAENSLYANVPAELRREATAATAIPQFMTSIAQYRLL